MKEHDIVRLKEDRNDLGVKSSYIGAIIDISPDGIYYTVEFIDENRETIEASLWTEFTKSELVSVFS